MQEKRHNPRSYLQLAAAERPLKRIPATGCKNPLQSGSHLFYVLFMLPCCGQHIFNQDAVARRRLIDQNMRDRADEPPVLQDGAAAHGCVKIGTTNF